MVDREAPDLTGTGFMGPELIRIAVDISKASNGELTPKAALKQLGELGAQHLQDMNTGQVINDQASAAETDTQA